MSAALEALYSRIPAVSGCRTGCNDCCGPVPLTRDEAAKVTSPIMPERLGAAMVTPIKACGSCAYSTAKGCAIYSARPFMCRLFGAVADAPRLACPHGAIAQNPLSPAEAEALTREYIGMTES